MQNDERAKMFLPFDALKGLKEALREKEKILVDKKILSIEEKEKILNINWKETDIKESAINKYIREKLMENQNLDIIVYGSEKYINNAGKIIDEIVEENVKKSP